MESAGRDATAAPETRPRRRRRWWPLATIVGVACAAAGWWTLQVGEPIPPVRVASITPLTSSQGVVTAAVSLDGRHLAWTEAHDGTARVWLRLDGATPTELVPAAPVSYHGIAFSPDGSTLFYSVRSTGHPDGELRAVSADGGPSRPIAQGIVSAPALSPDGRRVAFYRDAQTPHRATTLVTASVDGGDAQILMALPTGKGAGAFFAAGPSWSPDGARVAAVVRDGDAGQASLVVIDVASGVAAPLVGNLGAVWAAAWVPDGSGILLTANRATDGSFTPARVWLQPYPLGDLRPVTAGARGYRSLSARADGTAFVTVGVDEEYSLWSVPLDGRAPLRIASEPDDGLEGLAPLPDGRVVVSIGDRGRTQLAIIDRGGTTRQILTTQGANRWPAVTPDGRSVVFVSDRDGQTGIWRMELEGTEPRLVAHLRDPSWLSVTPDGRFVICAAQVAADSAVASWRVAIDGGEPVVIAPGLDRPTVSPDGLLLTGVAAMPVDGDATLITMRLDGRVPPRVISGVTPAQSEGLLEWAPTGQGLLLSTTDGAPLWLQPLGSEAPVQLENLIGLQVVLGRRTPDGSSLIVSSRALRSEAYLVSDFR